jgi:Protein of unknown function (DUF2783)
MAEQTVRVEDGFAGRGDDFYEALIRAHEGLSEAESHRLNARLVLVLANHVGNLTIVLEAIALARRSLEAEAAERPKRQASRGPRSAGASS